MEKGGMIELDKNDVKACRIYIFCFGIGRFGGGLFRIVIDIFAPSRGTGLDLFRNKWTGMVSSWRTKGNYHIR